MSTIAVIEATARKLDECASKHHSVAKGLLTKKISSEDNYLAGFDGASYFRDRRYLEVYQQSAAELQESAMQMRRRYEIALHPDLEFYPELIDQRVRARIHARAFEEATS